MGRRLGQHFLARKSILERIAAAACGEMVPLAVEIGPGKGALTERLLEKARKVIAVEIDPYLVHYCRQKFREAIQTGRLALVEGDILKMDLEALSAEGTVVTGNLPYYIASPVLRKVFELCESETPKCKRAVFLVQAEVACRLTAAPGSRDFGYLSVEAQLYSRAEALFPVPRAAFRPPPKVESAVVRLEPRDPAAEFGIVDRARFLRFASVCFRHKRKTLRNNLAAVYGAERLDALAESRRRAEQLSVRELADLYRKVEL